MIIKTKVPISAWKQSVSSKKGSMWINADLETLWDLVGIKNVYAQRRSNKRLKTIKEREKN